MSTSTIASPAVTATPVNRDSVAWDMELADTDLATIDYVPASGMCRGFVVFSTGGSTGNVQIVNAAGRTVTIPVSAGMMDNQQSYAFQKIVKAGTTATNIYALT